MFQGVVGGNIKIVIISSITVAVIYMVGKMTSSIVGKNELDKAISGAIIANNQSSGLRISTLEEEVANLKLRIKCLEDEKSALIKK